MLDNIINYVKHFADVIATVTGIDIEVVDATLVRVAGTGIYASGVGKSLASASQLYRHALSRRETQFVDNPKENPLCQGCPDTDDCPERLSLCAPIVAGDEILGIIGLVCFNDADRDLVLANREVYTYFVSQMADAIARVAESERNARENRQRLAMLLDITDNSARGVVVMDRGGCVTFANDAARRELGLGDIEAGARLTVTPTGDAYSDMEEYEVFVENGEGAGGSGAPAGNVPVVLGRLSVLGQNDAFFDQALVFDSKPQLTAMLSHLGGDANNAAALGPIIGASAKIVELKKRVLQIAATSSTVLVTGESGTGKEMFARAIHAASPRRDKPFVAINCGAIPDNLLESELFGYVRGAFTDASPAGRMGKFELADTGVLFLDEISSMPLYLQVKLLRILQERTFYRLGSNKMVTVDLRVIAATNEKLPQLIAQRMFREDLYYRLNVIPLDIPPLRERMDDIPVLAEHFLEKYCRLFDKPKARLGPDLLERLRAYHWPGNIREFENCIEYLVNMHEGGALTAAALPAKVAAGGNGGVVGVSGEVGVAPVVALAEMEREAIRNALGRFGDSAEGKRMAAEALGIGIATLYRKLRQ